MRRRGKELRLAGDLQAEIMTAVWRLGEASVENIRAEQPAARRSAYTTIQTVMNRLVERGLLTRERRGRTYFYRAKYDEAAYVTRDVGARLAEASAPARHAALVSLVEALDPGELDDIARYVARLRRERRRR